MPLYSIIVPTYNAEGTIETCLSAFKNQSIPKEDYEVIVVDDGSTDGTADIVKRYPVKYIRQENKGPAAARNNGANHAVGDIILFSDSDCVPDANWVNEMVKPFEDAKVTAVRALTGINRRVLWLDLLRLSLRKGLKCSRNLSLLTWWTHTLLVFEKTYFSRWEALIRVFL